MKVSSAVLQPVFLVLIKCLALSNPASMRYEGGAGEMGEKPGKICPRKLQEPFSMTKWWPWVILAMGTSAAERTRPLREDPVLPNFSMGILSPTDRQSWTVLCRIWGAARTGTSGGEVASPGLTNDPPADAVSCPAAPLKVKGGRGLSPLFWGGRRRILEGGWGLESGSCRWGLHWVFKMVLCSWRNVKQLLGRASSTTLSCKPLQVQGG